MESTTSTHVPVPVPAHLTSNETASPVSIKTGTTHIGKDASSEAGKSVVAPNFEIEDGNVDQKKSIRRNAAVATESPITDKFISISKFTEYEEEKDEGSVEASAEVEKKYNGANPEASSSPKTVAEPSAAAAPSMGPVASSNVETSPIMPAHAGSPISLEVLAIPMTSTYPTAMAQIHTPVATANMEYRKSASLYVGDLHAEVDEAALYDVFQGLGPMQSIRVCRDLVTRRSLGYGYLNFVALGDAERALESMNFYEGPLTRNRPLRLMWKLRDPSQRRTGEGNIFVKGLDHSIDNKTLFDTFSQFGAILSSKIAVDESRRSLGYGFVHFESPSAAAEAIRQVNGMLLKAKKVTVQKFISKSERYAAGRSGKTFTNLYIKQLDLSRCNEEGLREIFEKFGAITSIHVPIKANGTAMGYAFVNFESDISAQKAMGEMAGKEMDGNILYVNRAQRRSERQAELRNSYAAIRRERQKKRQGANVYIKNISEDVTEDVLREKFSPYGSIKSCVVMKDNNGVSRGFGFVCFSRSDEASGAIAELHGQTIGSKAVYVAFAQHRNERHNQIRTQRQRSMTYRDCNLFVPGGIYRHPSPQQTPYMFHPNMGQNMAMTPLPYPTHGIVPSRPHSPISVGAMIKIPQIQTYHQRQGAVHMPAHPALPQMPSTLANGQTRVVRQNPMIMNSATSARPLPRRNRVRPMHHNQLHHENSNVFIRPVNGNPRPIPVASSAVPVQIAKDPLTLEMLTAATPGERTELLGVRLFPLIEKLSPERATKITGMILELDVSEVLDMLETPDTLSSRVKEAVELLNSTNNDEEDVDDAQSAKNEKSEIPDDVPDPQFESPLK